MWRKAVKKYCSFCTYDLLLIIIEKLFFSGYFYCRCALVMVVTMEKISLENAFPALVV